MRYKVQSNNREFEIELNQQNDVIEVTCNQKSRKVRVEEIVGDRISAFVDDRPFDAEVVKMAQSYTVYYQGGVYAFLIDDRQVNAGDPPVLPLGSDKEVCSPMYGIVLSVAVQPGQQVNKGDQLLVIEAMKMENEIRAPHDGEIKEVVVRVGQNVQPDQPLISFA
jgi:propionyl-CoA carboxylase alpha chain